MKKCFQCGKEIKNNRKFCSRICYFKFPKSNYIKLKIKKSVLKAYKREDVKHNHLNNTPRGKNHPFFNKRGQGTPFYGKKHNKETLRKMSLKQEGQNHPMYGKKHKEESKNKIRKSCRIIWNDEMRNKQRQRMLNGQAAYCNTFINNPSKPQIELFKIIKEMYPNSKLNFQILNYSIDIVIPEFKLAIEYDGSYWHKDKKEYDQKRQQKIESLGWKFIRYVDYIPSKEEFILKVKETIS